MQNQSKTKEQQWNIILLLEWTTSYFKSRNIDSPRACAEILLAHSLKLKRIDLYIRYDQPLSRDELKAYKELIIRRANKEPVSYITGKKDFWNIQLSLTNDVLIPRPETEILVEYVLSILPESITDKNCNILELGTGSGAIILSLALERPGHLFFASDKSFSAILIAKKNAKNNNLDRIIDFFVGNWLDTLKQGSIFFDMIVSNPPYISSNLIEKLQAEVSKYEPLMALDGGHDGLNCIRYIISNAHFYLKKHGYLILEIGYDQEDKIKDYIKGSTYYENIRFVKDYSGFDRVLILRKA